MAGGFHGLMGLLFKWWSAEEVDIVEGPYSVAAAFVFVPGGTAGRVFTPGGEKGRAFTPGAQAGKVQK